MDMGKMRLGSAERRVSQRFDRKRDRKIFGYVRPL